MLKFKLRHSRCGTPKHTQTVIDATQKETAIDEKQQHSCEKLICQHHQTILRLLSNAAMASTGWRVRELYCQSTYEIITYFLTCKLNTKQNCCSGKAISIIYSECVCVCSLRYPAYIAHAPYFHLWPVWIYHIIPHYLINVTIFQEKLLNVKCVF